MPTYEYVCDACEHAFEEFHSITAKPLRKCPECGKSKLRRLIGTGAGIIFKGSGFYETDYRSDSYRKSAEAESKSGTDAAASSSKSDSPAAASDSGKASGTDSKPKADAAAPKSKPETSSAKTSEASGKSGKSSKK